MPARPRWSLCAVLQVPSFVIGRNPYVRILSGYLDKMVDNPARHDQWTFHSVNHRMRLPMDTAWPPSVDGFRRFVRRLADHGLIDQVRPFWKLLEAPSACRALRSCKLQAAAHAAAPSLSLSLSACTRAR